MTALSNEDVGQPDALDPPVLALIGPTASGKSAVAMTIAPQLAAEIVAVDSMTIYRGMDAGTAKPSADDRRRVPHHLIDIADPARPYSVASFQAAARSAIAGIRARGRSPLLVGGSGLYFRAVVDELTFPPTDAGVRARLAEGEPAELQEKLEATDPDAAARIEGANVRRIVRALEVMELTGTPFSSFRAAWDEHRSRYPLIVAGLSLEQEELSARIARRTRTMFQAGLIEEVRGLLDKGLRGALTASRAIGYREAVAVIDGTISAGEAEDAVGAATRRYARRQMTWFRKDPRIVWVDGTDVDKAAALVLACFRSNSRDPSDAGR